MYGRRRVLSTDAQDEDRRADRQAVNAVIQGTAADIVKKAMIEIDMRLRGTSATLLLQIHDELIYEVDEPEAEHTLAVIKDCMEKVAKLDVPLPVSLKMGKSWGSLRPYQIANGQRSADTMHVGGSSTPPHTNTYSTTSNHDHLDQLSDDDLFDDILSSLGAHD